MFSSVGVQRKTVTNLPQRELGGRKVTPQKVDIGGQSEFSFVALDHTAIYEHVRQAAGAVEPEILAKPSYYLKYPLKAAASWEGETNMLMNKVRIGTTTTVESMDDMVTVRAGTFEHCVRTKTVGQTSQNRVFFGRVEVTFEAQVEERSWFCPSIGIVKNVRQETGYGLIVWSEQLSMELGSFKR